MKKSSEFNIHIQEKDLCSSIELNGLLQVLYIDDYVGCRFVHVYTQGDTHEILTPNFSLDYECIQTLLNNLQ